MPSRKRQLSSAQSHAAGSPEQRGGRGGKNENPLYAAKGMLMTSSFRVAVRSIPELCSPQTDDDGQRNSFEEVIFLHKMESS